LSNIANRATDDPSMTRLLPEIDLHYLPSRNVLMPFVTISGESLRSRRGRYAQCGPLALLWRPTPLGVELPLL
jgi:hypothetical protein